jgi:thiol-disulfide isomerase/thioredoxin
VSGLHGSPDHVLPVSGLRLAVVAVAAIVLAAGCGGGPDGDATTTIPTDSPAATTTTSPATQLPGDPEATTTTTTRVPPDGEPAPDFTLALGDGGRFSLGEETLPVYLLFWAEWCPICRREMPVVDAVAADYLDRVTFVAVAGRSTLEASRARVGEWFSPDRLLWGYDDDLWGAYAVRGQPVSVLISSDGVIVDRWYGAVGEASLRDRLDALVAIG